MQQEQPHSLFQDDENEVQEQSQAIQKPAKKHQHKKSAKGKAQKEPKPKQEATSTIEGQQEFIDCLFREECDGLRGLDCVQKLQEFDQNVNPYFSAYTFYFQNLFDTFDDHQVEVAQEKLVQIFQHFKTKNMKYKVFSALCESVARHPKVGIMHAKTRRQLSSHWINQPNDRIVLYVEKLKLKEFIEDKEAQSLILDQIKQCEKSKDQMVHQTTFKLIKLFGSDENMMKAFIKTMNTNDMATKAADYIIQAGLNPDEFPQIKARLQKRQIRYYLNEYPWQKAEEIACEKPDLLGFMVEDYLFKGKKDVAFSIALRNNLIGSKYIQKVEAVVELNDMYVLYCQQALDVIPNALFVQDNFVPTDSIFNPAVQYLKLEDLGYREEDVTFISGKNDDYQLAVQILKSATIIGIDCEFRGSGATKLDNDDQQQVAITQIATKEKVFIFDGYTLEKDEEFRDFLVDILENPNIKKVGHTLQGDLTQLRRTHDVDLEWIEDCVDVKELFSNIYPNESKIGLAHIAKIVFGRELSKMDQCSHWGKRPLRKAQLHYAALDAAVCVHLYEKLLITSS